MPPLANVPTIETPDKTFNRWIMRVTDWVNSLKNVSTSGIAVATVSLRSGINIHVPPFPIAIAQTDGSGITARSGSTAGIGNITLQTFDGVSNAIAADSSSSGNKDKAYNFSASGTVGANKYVIVMKIFGYWFVVSEEC